MKVGDKILIRTTPSRWNGRKAEAIYQGEVVNLDPERVKIRLPEGEEIEVPLGQIEILEVKESIFQRIISFVMEVFNRVALGVFWIKDRLRFKRR